jgi:hypothetical protein
MKWKTISKCGGSCAYNCRSFFFFRCVSKCLSCVCGCVQNQQQSNIVAGKICSSASFIFKVTLPIFQPLKREGDLIIPSSFINKKLPQMLLHWPLCLSHTVFSFLLFVSLFFSLNYNWKKTIRLSHSHRNNFPIQLAHIVFLHAVLFAFRPHSFIIIFFFLPELWRFIWLPSANVTGANRATITSNPLKRIGLQLMLPLIYSPGRLR